MKNSVKAFTIKANVPNKTWLSQITTLTASNEIEAIDKAKKILMLTNEHVIELIPVTVFSIATTLSTDNYPYGYLKCKATYQIEYNSKKGCRSIFQTINPKNGRLNNPKKSTYTPVVLPCTIDSTGNFSSCGYLSFNGTEEINKGLHFMNDFYSLFTPEQIKDIALLILSMIKVNIKAQVIYCGSTWENLKPLYDQPIRNLTDIVNGNNTNFLTGLLDFDKIEACKVPDYKPFTVSSQFYLCGNN